MKTFEVEFYQPTYYYVRVEARDEIEARSKAWDEFQSIQQPHDIGDADIDSVKEIDDDGNPIMGA